MWILILTLLCDSANIPVAIPGFSSNVSCQNAGHTWASDLMSNVTEGYVHYVCVKKS